MIECRDADVLAAAMSVGSLDNEEHGELDRHLAACADCRKVTSEYMAAAGLLALAAEPVKPSPELRTRLMRAVYAEAMQGERPRRTPLHRRLMGWLPQGRGFALLAGAAAGVVIGSVSVAGLTHATGPGSSATLAVTLTGQSVAPGAHGRLDYFAGSHEAMLSVTGLASPSAGSTAGAVYEVWLIPSDGIAVPAGFLSRSPGGAWTGAVDGNVMQYRTVAATIEPAGGSQSPTGSRVIQGAIPQG